MKDAAQDRRVRVADADDAYRKAIVKARADRDAAIKRADDQWRTACQRACAGAVHRRAMRASYRAMSDQDLVDMYNRSEYILSDEYARFRDGALEEQTMLNMYMMEPVLTSRGLLVSS